MIAPPRTPPTPSAAAGPPLAPSRRHTPHPAHAPHPRPRSLRRLLPRHHHRIAAFTLTELIVVIAIIVLLVGLLLGALGQVRNRALQSRTLATIRAFSAGCDAFQQEHGFLPGVVPEAILANDPQISGTENAVLHMMGGFVREEDVGTTSFDTDYAEADGWKPLSFTRPSGGPAYRIKVNLDRLGDGPIVAGKPYAPYLAPNDRDFGLAEGQANVSDDLELPDVLDAWGQPIIYLRHQRGVGPITTENAPGGPPGNQVKPQYDMAPMRPYLDSTELGKLRRDQTQLSVLNQASAPAAFLGKLIEHPALPGQARGAYMLLSAGADGVYFSIQDGPGSENDPVPDIVDNMGQFLPGYTANVFEEYDDVLQFGGS